MPQQRLPFLCKLETRNENFIDIWRQYDERNPPQCTQSGDTIHNSLCDGSFALSKYVNRCQDFNVTLLRHDAY